MGDNEGPRLIRKGGSAVQSALGPIQTTAARVGAAHIDRLTHTARQSDHVFHLAMTGAAIVAVFAGFGRTYYLKAVTGAPHLPGLIHLHGTVFSAWMLLFLAQTILVAAGRVDIHKRLGAWGACSHWEWSCGARLSRSLGRETGGARVSSMSSSRSPSRWATFWYLRFVAAGLYWRRSSEVHKRLMLLATIGGSS